jgi:ABC-type glutathione transport system ATPase component
MGNDVSTQLAKPNFLLRVRDLSKRYVGGPLWRRRVSIAALNVDLQILPRTTLALVGESGSGKSTVARCVARLEKPDSGQILLGDQDIANLTGRELCRMRSDVQMVFQDPVTSMNPRFTAAQVVEEPLLIQNQNSEQRREVARAALIQVGLPTDWLNRSIFEFSGGQRQRLALARALVVRPKLLVLDESLTGLDLSTQAQVANLLLDLQAARSLTYLLISHDLALVARMADEIAVMASGQIVERGPTVKLMTAPEHEETIRLVAAAKAASENFTAIAGAAL